MELENILTEVTQAQKGKHRVSSFIYGPSLLVFYILIGNKWRLGEIQESIKGPGGGSDKGKRTNKA